MIDTFLVYQISSKETIRYEIPIALQWAFDEWRDNTNTITVSAPRGLRLRYRSVEKILDSLRPECAELFNQIKVTKTPTSIWPRGYEGTITTYDYLI